MAENLTDKQKTVIVEFIKAGNVEQACKSTGIAKQTYYNWLKIPEFSKELKEQQDAVYNSSIVDMKSLFTKAVETQQELLCCENNSIRLRASALIINNTVKIIEAKEMKDRVNELENTVEMMDKLKELEDKYNATRTENA